MHGLDKTCSVGNKPPPKDFVCAPPSMLDSAIWNFNNDRDDMTKQPSAPEWPLLIPEVSDITKTTSRLKPCSDEGNWDVPDYDPIAWDMTGYLFDKIQGASWVREPDILQEEDWHYILGPKKNKNWIKNIIFIDRLPDRFAMQTPPTAIMTAYMNRIYAYHWHLISDEDAPRPWLMTHGYPSYIDWPPAWHWNLGIRMLSSLAEYLAAQAMGFMGPGPEAWYPDKSRKTTTDLRLPFVSTTEGRKLLWKPQDSSMGPTEMDWDYFPGIIPFVPGSTTTQLRWFAEKIVKMGFKTLALDALNTIAHENFKGLPEAISILKSSGAEHVMVYGPWPLHLPSKYVVRKNVSYIPNANHMDMTNIPPRYWLVKNDSKDGEKRKWRRLPSYKKTTLGNVVPLEGVEICICEACIEARTKEGNPRSIWRWSHLLEKGQHWMNQSRDNDGVSKKILDTKLWYQGPSYTIFRKCLHYPQKNKWNAIEDILDSLVIEETKLRVNLPDGTSTESENIHWTWWDEMHGWSVGFPRLED